MPKVNNLKKGHYLCTVAALKNYTLSRKQQAEKLRLELNQHWTNSLNLYLTSEAQIIDPRIFLNSLNTKLEPLHSSIQRQPSCQLNLFQVSHTPAYDLSYHNQDFGSRLFLSFNHEHYLKLFEVFSEKKRESVKFRANFISNELKEFIKLERGGLTKNDFLRIRTLIQELKSLLRLILSKQKRALRLINSKAGHTKITNLRDHIRNIVHFLFKHLPDFSGCEEEAEFTGRLSANPHSFKSQSLKSCLIQNIYLRQSTILPYP